MKDYLSYGSLLAIALLVRLGYGSIKLKIRGALPLNKPPTCPLWGSSTARHNPGRQSCRTLCIIRWPERNGGIQ